MTRDRFEQLLRSFLRRQPFEPFVVELREDKQVLIDEPEALAFDGGAAGFIGLADIHLFRCDEVRAIHPVSQEAAS